MNRYIYERRVIIDLVDKVSKLNEWGEDGWQVVSMKDDKNYVKIGDGSQTITDYFTEVILMKEDGVSADFILNMVKNSLLGMGFRYPEIKFWIIESTEDEMFKVELKMQHKDEPPDVWIECQNPIRNGIEQARYGAIMSLMEMILSAILRDYLNHKTNT